MNNDFKVVANALKNEVERVVNHLFCNGKREGNYWVLGDVLNSAASGNGSFKIGLSGKYQGVCRDFNGDNESFDLLDAWAKRYGISKADALKEAKEFLHLPVAEKKPSTPRKIKSLSKEIKVNNDMQWTSRLVNRLKSNKSALEYLFNRTLTIETIEYFKLGLSTPYKNKDGITSSNALVFPLLAQDGTFLNQNCYYNIPDITENPPNSNGWMKGSPKAYFTHARKNQKIMFIAEGIKDCWVLYQNLKEHDLLSKILICSSTHGSAIPAEMQEPEFWIGFDKIYLGHDHDSAGDKIAEKLSDFIPKDCYRVKCPSHYAKAKYSANGEIKPASEWGADWTDFFKADSCIEEFLNLLEEAPICDTKLEDADLQSTLNVEGRFNVAPIDINNAFIGGRMYYPIQTLVRQKNVDEYGKEYFLERYETVVVRSDGTIHKAIKSPAPPNTPDSERVIRLSDGTLIRSEPKPTEFSTWKWNNIDAFIKGKVKVRDTSSIFTDVITILKSTIWLPVEEDYHILALSVFVTYIQNIFESVPIIFLNGPAGSGKSQVGIIMSKLCCNGSVIGQVSAASAARHIDNARGFVVFDDLEGIASKGGKDSGQFSELVQALKVSYNKNTAEKIWTDVRTMKTERLNFFGVKLISNTGGADDILSTRMLRIQTRHMPDSEKGNIKKLLASDFTKIEAIRQELHAWAFSNCNKIEDLSAKSDNKTGRFDEIALPLRTIANMVSKECSDKLEVALLKQRTIVIESGDPIETLKEAVGNLIKNGYIKFTVTQVILELKTLLDDNFGTEMTNSIPDWKRPEWVGRQLRTLGYLSSKDHGRVNFCGKKLKVMEFNKYAIDEVIKELETTINMEDNPFSFCQDCSTCIYASVDCEFRAEKMKSANRKKLS